MKKDYQRMTEKAKDGSPALITEMIFHEFEKLQGQGKRRYYTDSDVLNIVIKYLAELEDKIEQGRFVEIPLTDKDILEDYARKIFDAWNDITGAINNNCSWYYEALSVIDDIVGMVWGITSRQYEAKLRELKGDRE